MKNNLTIYEGTHKSSHDAVVNSGDYWLAWDEAARRPGKPPGAHEIDLQSRLDDDYRANREKYTKWIHRLGAVRTRRGTSVRQALQLSTSAPSFWWLSLIAEKSPLKSGVILEAFKLMSLERLQREFEFSSIAFISQNRLLARTLELFCRNRNIGFTWIRAGKRHGDALKSRVPHPFAALLWLVAQFAARVRIARRHRSAKAVAPESEATIVTYAPNFDTGEAAQWRFRSNYWTTLHDWLVAQKGLVVNWILIHVPAAQASFGELCGLKEKFQATSKDRFFVLEEFLTFHDFFKTLFAFLQVAWRGWQLARDPAFVAVFRPAGSSLDFFGLFHREVAKSLWGVTAIENCLWQRKFARMLETISVPQRWGLYPCEFQAWEKILCSGWKTSGRHGHLVGYQHSTVSELMLNYHHDPRSLRASEPAALPMPDRLAVNGPFTRQMFLAMGYPAGMVAEVEALRYEYIKDLLAAPLPAGGARHLLVACDLVPENTRRQLWLLSRALIMAQDRPLAFENIWIKPHPFCPAERFVEEFDLSSCVKIVGGAIAGWMARASHVFAANSTSVALEALALGRQTAASASLDEMNLSPLLGRNHGFLIRTEEQLFEFLHTPINTSGTEACFFNFDIPFPTLLNTAANRQKHGRDSTTRHRTTRQRHHSRV